MLAAMAVSAVRPRRDPRLRPVLLPTVALLVTGLVGFFLVPVLGDAHFGLAQRVLIGSFITWMLVVAAGSNQDRLPGPHVRVKVHA
jgi:uncharacterized membrane protein (DUF4010 family)